MKKKSKRFKELLKSVVKDKKINVKEILELVKKNSTTKFDESIDISLNMNLKQSKGGDFSLRTVVNLPNASGKKNKVAVLCEPDKIEEAKKSGAEVFGSEDLIEKISFYLKNNSLRNEIALNGRKVLEEYYSPKKHGEFLFSKIFS